MKEEEKVQEPTLDDKIKNTLFVYCLQVEKAFVNLCADYENGASKFIIGRLDRQSDTIIAAINNLMRLLSLDETKAFTNYHDLAQHVIERFEKVKYNSFVQRVFHARICLQIEKLLNDSIDRLEVIRREEKLSAPALKVRKVKFKIPSDLLRLIKNEDQFCQIFQYLIDETEDFALSKGKVQVAISAQKFSVLMYLMEQNDIITLGVKSKDGAVWEMLFMLKGNGSLKTTLPRHPASKYKDDQNFKLDENEYKRVLAQFISVVIPIKRPKY